MEAIRPSTLEGIKRLAKTLKSEQGIQHARALDEAARLAGFENLRHARNVLVGVPATPKSKSGRRRSGHRLFITVYWKNRIGGETGRETLTIWLSVPLNDLVTAAQMQMSRVLTHFRVEGPDHLARQNLVESQSQARERVCAAARVLDFMDATGLRPSKGHSRAYPKGDSSKSVPGEDHASVWFEPVAKRYLLVDEPYEGSVQGKGDARAAWALRHGFDIKLTAWTGMYNPDGGTRLYLIADAVKGVPLDPLVVALDSLPAYFSDRGRLFQADRGRRFSAIVDAQRVRASGDSNVSQSSTISLKRLSCGLASGSVFGVPSSISGPCQAAGGAPRCFILWVTQ